MKRYKSYLPGIIIGAAIVIIIAVAGFFAWQQGQQSKDITDVNKVMTMIGKHMLLPTDETPALVTVVDKAKLGNDAFFKTAKNGDKVLVYQKNQEAIIYRPSIDRIVAVGPVQIDVPTGGGK